MGVKKDFEVIVDNVDNHWRVDWELAKKIYEVESESYSVLEPFAYSYLEYLIRYKTSQCGDNICDKNGKRIRQKVSNNLIALAKEENKENKELCMLLDELKKYFRPVSPGNKGDNRHSVMHGITLPINWNKKEFESLIHDIARLSKYQ